jgi:hypothetical protein
VVKSSPFSPSSPLAVLCLFTALAVLWTWPLGAYLASRIPHDPGDPVLNTYLLWWNAATMPFGARWWNPPFFYPMQGALALSEHLAGLAVISTPVQLLGGNPVLAYNLTLLASYALSAWFAYLLVRRLTGSSLAGLCAGIAYGFAPFRAGQLAHVQVLTSQWLPLQLLAMHAYLDDGRRRWLWLAGGAWLIQGLSNGYYLLFAPVLIGLWLGWFPRWRLPARRALALLAALVIASLPFGPLLATYREVHDALGLTRGAMEIASFSAKPTSFLNPPHLLAFWPPRHVPTEEDYLFPGLTVVVLIAACAVACVVRGRWRPAIRERSPFLFYSLAAVAMATLTFGPGEPDAGAARWIRPYYWLSFLPGFDSLRVPARFAMFCTLCAAIAAGLAVGRLAPARRAARAIFVGAVLLGLAIDGWMEPMPLLPPPGRLMLSNVPADAAILELPLDEPLVSINAMYRALVHRRPLINGYSGHFPPHFRILTDALRRQDPSPLLELARGRPLVIIVNDRLDRAQHLRTLVESLPGIERAGSGSAGAMYVFAAQPRERVAASGTPLVAVPAELPRAHVLLDLGGQRTVRTLEFPLRSQYQELGARFAVEASVDGAGWTTVWEDWTGGRALAGALEDQRTVPFRIPLPDVSARYLRIHPAPEWLVRELKVLGP